MLLLLAGAGLYPTDDLEAAKCDAIIDSSVDFGINVLPSMYENDEAKKVGEAPHGSEGQPNQRG